MPFEHTDNNTEGCPRAHAAFKEGSLHSACRATHCHPVWMSRHSLMSQPRKKCSGQWPAASTILLFPLYTVINTHPNTFKRVLSLECMCTHMYVHTHTHTQCSEDSISSCYHINLSKSCTRPSSMTVQVSWNRDLFVNTETLAVRATSFATAQIYTLKFHVLAKVFLRSECT